MYASSKTLFERAQLSIPGGVNSPVRAFKSVGGTPLFIKHAKGAYLYDVDDNKYIDYIASWGPMILGHAYEPVVKAIQEQAVYSTSYGAPTELEVKMAELIKSMAPNVDLIRMVSSGTEACMSALRVARGYTGKNKVIKLIDTLKYKYIYMAVDHFQYTATGDVSGLAIISRFPILDTGRITYDSKDNPEHIGFADIAFNSKKIRFYNTHLSSMQLTAERKNAGLDYTYIQDDTAILFNKSKLERIAIFDSFHVRQAQIVKQQLNKSPTPFVFCADLNSVPSSYVYHHISSGLQDAFLRKGFGWGPTYNGLSHTLRIDVTLLSPQLKVVQHYSPKLKASDHFPLVTDIAVPL